MKEGEERKRKGPDQIRKSKGARLFSLLLTQFLLLTFFQGAGASTQRKKGGGQSMISSIGKNRRVNKMERADPDPEQ